MPSRRTSFQLLSSRVASCQVCQEMSYSHVLGSRNGPLDAPLMIVGEAPGRFGAARTGVPFSGDRSGERFDRLLAATGMTRDQVFITNSLLCNPLAASGAGPRNRRPRVAELRSCHAFLAETLALVRAEVVAALGGVALKALALVEPHAIGGVLAAAGRPRPWAGRTLMPLVHPSPRTAAQRPWNRQLEDWRTLGELVRSSPR